MKRVLKRSRYTQRWQAETVNSMLKRREGKSKELFQYFVADTLLLVEVLPQCEAQRFRETCRLV